MDLGAYHHAWMQGFSESECVRIGEDAWEDQQMDEAARRNYEDEYYRQMMEDNPATGELEWVEREGKE